MEVTARTGAHSFSPSLWADRGRKPTENVRVWEDLLTIPTSEEGLPDSNPPFDFFNTGRFLNYPYTLRHNLVDRRVPRRWRTFNLENEYLKCTVSLGPYAPPGFIPSANCRPDFLQ